MKNVSSLDASQQQQLQEIGTYLHDVREAQERTLEDIATHTFIPLRLLRAIESGETQVLPEPVFVKGFIRRYADELGLDGLAIADAFSIHAPMVPPTIQDPELVNLSNERPALIPNIQIPTLPDPPQVKPVYGVIGLVAIACLGGLYWMLTSGPSFTASESNSSNTETADTSSSLDETASEISPLDATSPDSSSPTADSGNLAPSTPETAIAPDMAGQPVNVEVTLTEESWLSVTVDGDVEFEGILPSGEQQEWSAQDEITIVAGNAGAVRVAQNGGNQQPMGDPGQVEEMVVTSSNP